MFGKKKQTKTQRLVNTIGSAFDGRASRPLKTVGTAVGFFLSGLVPAAVSLGLVFINPIYFMLLYLGDLRARSRVLALVFGAGLAPAMHAAAPTWGLLITGVVAGVAAFLLGRAKWRHG